MSARRLSDCDHSKSGICARCVLQKAFNLSNNEALCVTQPQRLSCNNLYSLCTNKVTKFPLGAVYSTDSYQKSMDSESGAEILIVSKKSSTASLCVDDGSTVAELRKVISSESLNLGPRTAGDGADDEESLTGTIISGEYIWQGNCENDGLTSRFSVSKVEKRKNPGACVEPENRDEINMTKQNNVKNFPRFAVTNRSWLLRLFESDLFDIRIAIRYLSSCKEAGVLNYLGNRLFDLPTEMVDFYIPQLIVLYINMQEVAEVIHPYIVKRCKDSVEFSLECCWLLDAYGINIFRKFEQKSHGHHLRQSILNEFRERSDDLKSTLMSLSSPAQQHFRTLSEASKHF